MDVPLSASAAPPRFSPRIHTGLRRIDSDPLPAPAPDPLPASAPDPLPASAPEPSLPPRQRSAPRPRTTAGRAPAARKPWLPPLQLLLAMVWAISLALIAGSLALSIGPRFAPFEAFIVLSGSMEPLIHVGSVEVVRPVSPESLQVGDIITYQRIEEPDITVTHRITTIAPSEGGPALRTKGDVNDAEDPWELQLRGRAWKHVFSVPAAGYVFVFAQTAAGRLLTLVLPATILATLWLHEIWRAKRPVPAPA